ncbi:MAG: nitrate reductase molybdenum cofactor assembly chaperone [Rhodospirillaceae bacterium]
MSTDKATDKATDQPIKSLKALGALLTYPEAELISALDEIADCLDAEGMLSRKVRQEVQELIELLRLEDLLTLQEQYVLLFDRTRTLCLHLYEHVFGESRDRGQAMVRLAQLYDRQGYEIAGRELPDYLPLLCEFLAQVPAASARAVLADAVTPLAALQKRLAARGEPHAAVLAGMIEISGGKVNQAELEAFIAAQPKDPETLEELDRQAEEEPVSFGAGSALKDCAVVTGRGLPNTAAATAPGSFA